MKKYSMGIIFIISSLILMSCSDSGGSSDSSPYIIKFRINGTLYEFSNGYNDINGNSEGNDYNTITSYIAAVPSGAANNDDVFVMIRVNGTDVGTFDDSGNDNDLNFYYCFNGATHRWKDDDTAVADFTLTITKYDDVGGVIEGTFEGPVANSDTLATADLTDGYFYVERVADESLTAPW